MRSTVARVIVVLSLIGVASCPAAAQPAAPSAAQKLIDLDLWTPSDKAPAALQLPALATPVLDGQLTEWADASDIPVRVGSLISEIAKNRTYGGADDASMELHLAWTAAGLCIAADVVDQEVLLQSNQKDVADLSQQDCVQFVIDTRTDAMYGTMVPGKGLTTVTVIAPEPDQPAVVYLNGQDAAAAGITCASARTRNGYRFETVVPWAAINSPAAKTGNRLGIAYCLRDADRKNQTRMNVALAYQGAPIRQPQAMMDWQLADAVKPGTRGYAGPEVSIDAPRVFSAKSVNVAVDLGPSLSARQVSIGLALEDSAGKSIDVPLTTAANATWVSFVTARGQIDTSRPAAGAGRLVATVRDKDGQVIGESSRPALVAWQTADALSGVFDDAQKLAQEQPFKANAYLGAAASLQRFRRLTDRPMAARSPKPETRNPIETRNPKHPHGRVFVRACRFGFQSSFELRTFPHDPPSGTPPLRGPPAPRKPETRNPKSE